MINILIEFLIIFIFNIFPLTIPKINNDIRLDNIDNQKACLVSIMRYGNKGIKPHIKYDANIIIEASRGFDFFDFKTSVDDSSVAFSDKKNETR
jgi:hypothetical protein